MIVMPFHGVVISQTRINATIAYYVMKNNTNENNKKLTHSDALNSMIT